MSLSIVSYNSVSYVLIEKVRLWHARILSFNVLIFLSEGTSKIAEMHTSSCRYSLVLCQPFYGFFQMATATVHKVRISIIMKEVTAATAIF